MAAARVELLLIAAVALISLSGVVAWPDKLSSGNLVLALSGLFLAQTLVRDLYLLYRRDKRENMPEEVSRPVFCVETTVGVAGVIVGSMLIFASAGPVVAVSDGIWVILVALTMLLCFALRDYVVQWNPWAIRRDPDHVNIIVRIR